ncbi:MAG: Rv3654c family TadE-like protein [Rhodoglobus sp.]
MLSRPGGEHGSGSILAVALVAGLASLASLSLPLYMGLATRQSVAAAADAAALAGADVEVGILSGYPCDAASRVAAANGAALSSCDSDGLVVTVSATRYILGIPVTSFASAGPPEG